MRLATYAGLEFGIRCLWPSNPPNTAALCAAHVPRADPDPEYSSSDDYSRLSFRYEESAAAIVEAMSAHPSTPGCSRGFFFPGKLMYCRRSAFENLSSSFAKQTPQNVREATEALTAKDVVYTSECLVAQAIGNFVRAAACAVEATRSQKEVLSLAEYEPRIVNYHKAAELLSKAASEARGVFRRDFCGVVAEAAAKTPPAMYAVSSETHRREGTKYDLDTFWGCAESSPVFLSAYECFLRGKCAESVAQMMLRCMNDEGNLYVSGASAYKRASECYESAASKFADETASNGFLSDSARCSAVRCAYEAAELTQKTSDFAAACFAMELMKYDSDSRDTGNGILRYVTRDGAMMEEIGISEAQVAHAGVQHGVCDFSEKAKSALLATMDPFDESEIARSLDPSTATRCKIADSQTKERFF